jgi:hypothetical protein
MELYFGETPLLVPQFFAYRRKQSELWKDVGIFIVLIDVCSAA